jgi:hypothetical protein
MPTSTVDSVCDDCLDMFLASLTTTSIDPEALPSRSEPDRHLDRWSVPCGYETRISCPVWQAARQGTCVSPRSAITVSSVSATNLDPAHPHTGRFDVVDRFNPRTRKWTVSGVIRDRDTNGCYFLDPGTQHASQACSDAVIAEQFVLLWGARASGTCFP